MNNNQKEKENNILKQVIISINNQDYQTAKYFFNQLTYTNNPKTVFKLNYLKGFIKDIEQYNNIDKTIISYIHLGNKYLKNEKYKEALKVYKEGQRKTNDSLFDYYIGKCFIEMQLYNNAIKNLNDYKNTGYMKLKECYYYLCKSYEMQIKRKTHNKVEREYKKQNIKNYNICDINYNLIEQLENGILYPKMEYDKEIITNDNNVTNLIDSGQIATIIDQFSSFDDNKKITVLAILYKNNLAFIADKLLKEYEEQLKQNCKDELKTLVKNKNLYIKQAKV